MSWGLELPDEAIDLARLPELARRIEDAGFRSVWAGETSGNDAVAVLSLIGAAAREIRLGTAVLPVYTRAPGLLAMSAGSLARAFPGRVSLGIGASSAVVVERWNGVPFQRPFARVADTLHFLRAALAGEKVRRDYETFRIRGFTLVPPPEKPPPLLVGATGPKMLEFALREADGVILNWCTAQDLAGLPGLPKDPDRAFALLSVVPSDDREHVYELVRPYVAQYLSVPAYAGQQRRFGRGELLEPVWQAWSAGDYRGAAAALPTEVIDQLVVHGSPAHCRERIAEFTRVSGVTPLVIPMGDHLPLSELACTLGPEATDS